MYMYWSTIIVFIISKLYFALSSWSFGFSFNSLAPGWRGCNFEFGFSNHGKTDILSTSGGIALRWMPYNVTGDKSTFLHVHAMAWCHMASRGYCDLSVFPFIYDDFISRYLGLGSNKYIAKYVTLLTEPHILDNTGLVIECVAYISCIIQYFSYVNKWLSIDSLSFIFNELLFTMPQEMLSNFKLQ